MLDLIGTPVIDSALSYVEGKRRADSIVNLQQDVIAFNDISGSNFTLKFGSLSVQESFKDFARSAEPRENEEKVYFIGFDGYKLNERDNRFYRTNDSYNLIYTQQTPVSERKNPSDKTPQDKNDFSIKSYATKPIRVAYSSSGKTIYVPVSYRQYQTVEVSLYAAAVVLTIAALYFLLALPFALIRDIARGNAFIPENVVRLNWIAIGCCVFGFLSILFPFLFRLLIMHKIPAEFEFQSLGTLLSNNYLPFVIALIAAFTAQAFRRGYVLENEQNLTI
ncbi:MAG: DUF2975 domain-containing protein [Sphingobacteriales bacterium]|nr:MAG: DUF2975 domain-containing protein [Sphingobacteriales bacterium]